MNGTHHFFRHGRFRNARRRLLVPMAVVGGSLVGYQFFSEEESSSTTTTPSTFGSFLSSVSRSLDPQSSLLERESPNRNETEKSASTKFLANSLAVQQRKTRVESRVDRYDFVIVGYGNAGQSALRTLQQLCPRAKIALVDPLRSPGKKNSHRKDNTEYYKDTVLDLDAASKSVRLKNHRRVGYNHGILIATGARGAPPPLELFQDETLSRVLELRPTEIFQTTKRPMMSPEKVRKTVAEAAASGAKIGILGSGWEALDLLLIASENASKTKRKPTICFASQGIAWHTLPPYLSAEVRKKLQRKDIDLQDRSVVRYVADYKNPHNNCQQIELHNAKAYDLLDTRRTVLDLLVLAPDSFGDKGTAALPTPDIPNKMKDSSDGRPWYKTWSQLAATTTKTANPVVCFEDDGRIAVNTELSVSSRIYAAGGCAKYPNTSTGHSSVAGEGSIDGTQAGTVAALNMSMAYRRQTAEDPHSFALHSLPVWRSDITSYPATNGDRTSSLSGFGIQALCVGNCDSERQSTRAFWWTNSSAHRKMNRFLQAEQDSRDNDDDDHENDSDEEEEDSSASLQRRKSLVLGRRKTGRSSRGDTPIYGIGVVFYLDHYGRLQGIMTWGLPFADEPGGSLNQQLVDTMKDLIRRNAGVRVALEQDGSPQVMNIALGIASQRLVSLAKSRDAVSTTTCTWHGLDGPIVGYATPLYRYTEVSHSRNKSLNVLKRQDGSGLGVLGEGLYARDDDDALWEDHNETAITPTIPPANIPTTMYPISAMNPVFDESAHGDKSVSVETMLALNEYLTVQRWWEANENRARPGKEDPLWLRPGDEQKNTSGKQNTIDAYKRILFPHRSE